VSHDLTVNFFGETFPFAQWTAMSLRLAEGLADPPESQGFTFEPAPADAEDERLLRAIWNATDDPEPRWAYARVLAARGDPRSPGMLAQLAGSRSQNREHSLDRGFPGRARFWFNWMDATVHVEVQALDGTHHPPDSRFDVVVSTSMGRNFLTLFYQFLWPYLALRVFEGVDVHDCQRCEAGFFRDPAAYARHARVSLHRDFAAWKILRRLRMVDAGDDPFVRYAALV
jgi:hypothetical protein